jgi:hypothetical protein
MSAGLCAVIASQSLLMTAKASFESSAFWAKAEIEIAKTKTAVVKIFFIVSSSVFNVNF